MNKRLIRLIAGLLVSSLPIMAFFKFHQQDINIDLKTVNRTTDIIRDKGITNKSSVVGGRIQVNKRVFYVKLYRLYATLGVYRKNQDYTMFDQSLQIGDTVTIYYRHHPSAFNLDVFQIEKHGQIIVDYKSYSKNYRLAANLCLIIGILMAAFTIVSSQKQRT